MPPPTLNPRRSPAGRLAEWWEQLGYGTEQHSRRALVLAALGVLTGLAETAVMVLAVGLAAGEQLTLPLVGGEPPGTEALAALALAAILILAAAHLASARATARFGTDAERAIQQRLVAAYLRAPWGAQSASRAGDLQDLVLRNAAFVAQGTQQASVGAATAFNLAVVLVAAFVISPWTTVLLAVAMAFVVAVAVPFRARTRRAIDSTVATTSGVAAEVTETAGLARDLRVFGVTEAALEQVDASLDRMARLNRSLRQLAIATPRLTRDAAVALLVAGVAVTVATSDVAFPTLAIAVLLVFRALGLAQAIAGVIQGLAERRANLELIRRRLAEWAPDGVRGHRPCATVRRVRLAGVTHAYAPDSPPALAAVDMAVEHGEMLGLVGPSGAGKTTLASVLLGLTRPAAGTVEVDGAPLEEIDPAQWHARTAWVAQEPRLLTGTLAANVRFLRPWIDDERVRSAIAAAGLGSEVAAWPDGIEHAVGPAGAHLSGGERQRVALARAIAGGPDLIVLDEPTSALDAHTEAAVRTALDELRERAAVVVIAHRLSTIRSCDRVAVMEAGRIVAIAPPRELETTSPWFRRALDLSSASEPLP